MSTVLEFFKFHICMFMVIQKEWENIWQIIKLLKYMITYQKLNMIKICSFASLEAKLQHTALFARDASQSCFKHRTKGVISKDVLEFRNFG